MQTFQDTDNMLVPQFRCFAIPIQRFVQFPHFVVARRCVMPLVRFWWFCEQVLVYICVQECCVYVNRNCDAFALWVTVSIMYSWPTLFSETASMVLVETCLAEWHPDIGCSPSEPASISRDRLSLDRLIVFESLVCQVPQTASQLSWLPLLSVSSATSAFPSSFLRNRQVVTGSSSSAPLHSEGFSSSPVSSFRTVLNRVQ